MMREEDSGEGKNNCIKRESNPRRIESSACVVATIQVTTTPLMLAILFHSNTRVCNLNQTRI